MSLLDTLLICLMAFGLVIWLGEPLLRRAGQESQPHGHGEDTDALLLQKETLYTALRDLDFDFQTGKVDTQDYADLRQQLEGEALHILRQIDVVDPLARLDQEIEVRLAALQEAQARRAEHTSSPACAHCSAALVPEADFCPFCGRNLRS